MLSHEPHPARWPIAVSVLLVATVLAGCTTTTGNENPAGTEGADGNGNGGSGRLGAAKLGNAGGSSVGSVDDLLPGRALMTLTPYVVTPAKGIVQDLYEPTIAISGNAVSGTSGAMYVSGHVIGAFTTGTPAYVSTNAGVTWTQLPIVSTIAAPSPVQGSAPPGGDEGYIVADDAGHAWMIDMQDGVQMSVQGWCNNGATACFYQPDVYDQVNGAVCPAPFGVGSVATDRPWAAHAKVGSTDWLLMVNNGFAGTLGNVAQIGLLDVTPTSLPVGAVFPFWNSCAGGAQDGYIPGVPSMYTDGVFMVPQIMDRFSTDPELRVITGTTAGGVYATTTYDAFDVKKVDLACSSNFGFSGVDDNGNFFVAATDTNDNKRIRIGATTSAAGFVFQTTTITTANPVAYLWISGSQTGTGAFISWAEDLSGGACTNVTFKAAHVTLSGGVPSAVDTTTVATGKSPCGDMMGSDVGPDGKGVVIVFSHPNQCLDTLPVLPSPLTAYVQTSGPTI